MEQPQLQPLLEQLDREKLTSPGQIDGWQVEPIRGGANNMLYRASSDAGTFAVKFTMRDPRRRAEREYIALTLLESLGLDLAPHAIYYDQDHYRLPLIVQTWIEGEVSAEPPMTDADWLCLIDYHAAVHSITLDQIETAAPHFKVEKPILYAESPQACKDILRQKLERLPMAAQPESLRELYARFNSRSLPNWDAPVLSLVRNDPNPRNFIRRNGGGWASVDWEYSGITDPAFQIADLLAHPQYLTVPRARQEWVIGQYCAQVHDADVETRIRVYWLTLTIWWVARFAQYLYEIPLGLDARLVEHPPDWKEQGERKYTHYLQLAESLV